MNDDGFTTLEAIALAMVQGGKKAQPNADLKAVQQEVRNVYNMDTPEGKCEEVLKKHCGGGCPDALKAATDKLLKLQ